MEATNNPNDLFIVNAIKDMNQGMPSHVVSSIHVKAKEKSTAYQNKHMISSRENVVKGTLIHKEYENKMQFRQKDK